MTEEKENAKKECKKNEEKNEPEEILNETDLVENYNSDEKKEKCSLFGRFYRDKNEIRKYLDYVETLQFSDKREIFLYRCKECEEYVIHDHEEISCYWTDCDWDDLDIYDRFYHVHDVKKLSDGTTSYKASDDGETFFDHYHE